MRYTGILFWLIVICGVTAVTTAVYFGWHTSDDDPLIRSCRSLSGTIVDVNGHSICDLSGSRK